MIASSGSPFNITSPNDLNGDSVFNDRPGFISTATCATTTISPTDANVYCTPVGTFDARPDLAATTQRILPINYATGTTHFVLNLRLTKTFGFGPKTKGAATGQGLGGPGGGPAVAAVPGAAEAPAARCLAAVQPECPPIQTGATTSSSAFLSAMSSIT